MNFTVGLFNNGVPDDSLSPVINIWEAGLNGTKVVTNGAMDRIAVGAGGYTYDFVGADNTKNYYAEAYAAGLPAGQQYAPCITSVQGEVSEVLEDTSTNLDDTVSSRAPANEYDTELDVVVSSRAPANEYDTELDVVVSSRAPANEYDTELAALSVEHATLVSEHAALSVEHATLVSEHAALSVQNTAIAGQIVLAQVDITFIRGCQGGSWRINGNTLVYRDEAGSIIKTFALVGTAPDFSERNNL